MKKNYIKRLLSMLLVLSIVMNSVITAEAKSEPYKKALNFSNKTFSNYDTISKTYRSNGNTTQWFKFNSGSMGEYNIYSTGSVDTKIILYKKTLTGIKKVASDDNSGSSRNFKLGLGLEKNKTYYMQITFKNRGYTNIYLQVNYDKYTGTKFKTEGGSWEPNSNTYQPYISYGQFYKKVTYLTPSQSAIYAAGLMNNKYLKMLNAGTDIGVILAMEGISKVGIVGRFITKLGNKKSIKIISAGLSAWGISVVPKLDDYTIKAVQEKSGNYNYGVIITSIWTQRGMYTNSYERWNVQNTSVYGKKYCRGKFKAGDIKVGGWY